MSISAVGPKCGGISLSLSIFCLHANIFMAHAIFQDVLIQRVFK